MDKSVFFLLLSLICFYLVLDEVYGSKPISRFTVAIIPNAEEKQSSVHESDSGNEHGGNGVGF